jgi:hypothetical protein
VDGHDGFVETTRDELPCGCGCGRRWLVSQGRFEHAGEVASFIAIPMIHGDERVAWMALGRGAPPAEWVLTRSRLDGTNIAAGAIDLERSPIRILEPFATRGAKAASRDRVLADAGLKARTFVLHDALLRRHADLQQLFDPERGRDFSFRMPDCVFAAPAAERSPKNQQNFADHHGRWFVRALLPIPVGDGGELRIGVWVEVERPAFMALLKVFWDDGPAYTAMRLDGVIETSMVVGGHDVSGAPVELAARTADQCLFVKSTGTDWLARLVESGVSTRDLPRLVGEIRASVSRHDN